MQRVHLCRCQIGRHLLPLTTELLFYLLSTRGCSLAAHLLHAQSKISVPMSLICLTIGIGLLGHPKKHPWCPPLCHTFTHAKHAEP